MRKPERLTCGVWCMSMMGVVPYHENIWSIRVNRLAINIRKGDIEQLCHSGSKIHKGQRPIQNAFKPLISIERMSSNDVSWIQLVSATVSDVVVPKNTSCG